VSAAPRIRDRNGRSRRHPTSRTAPNPAALAASSPLQVHAVPFPEPLLSLFVNCLRSDRLLLTLKGSTTDRPRPLPPNPRPPPPQSPLRPPQRWTALHGSAGRGCGRRTCAMRWWSFSWGSTRRRSGGAPWTAACWGGTACRLGRTRLGTGAEPGPAQRPRDGRRIGPGCRPRHRPRAPLYAPGHRAIGGGDGVGWGGGITGGYHGGPSRGASRPGGHDGAHHRGTRGRRRLEGRAFGPFRLDPETARHLDHGPARTGPAESAGPDPGPTLA
jgi:hypothetical protein